MKRSPCRWLLASWLSTVPGHAEPGASLAEPPSATAQCRSANALSALACELRLSMPGELGPVLVAAGPVEASGGERLAELSARLAEVVAGRFDTTSEPSPMSLGAARARRPASEPSAPGHLLYLTPRINGAQLEVTADLYPLVRTFWDRFKRAQGPLHHVFASRPIDGEVGSFLPVPKLLGTIERKTPLPSDSVVALACGDVDGDRALELVVVGRRQVMLGRVRGAEFQVLHQVPWQGLSPVAPAPLRQPLASAHVVRGRQLLVGSSDRRDLVRLGPRLELLGAVPNRLPWGDLGCVARAGMGLAPSVLDCEGERIWERLPDATELDVAQGGTFQTRTGTSRVLVTRRLGQSLLTLQDDDGRQAQLAGGGAQLALADLDRDGLLELASSKDTLEPTQDALRVHQWQPDGLKLLYELPVPSGIHALGACPSEDANAALLVVATRDELWFVR